MTGEDLRPELWAVSPGPAEDPLVCVYHGGDGIHKVSG